MNVGKKLFGIPLRLLLTAALALGLSPVVAFATPAGLSSGSAAAAAAAAAAATGDASAAAAAAGTAAAAAAETDSNYIVDWTTSGTCEWSIDEDGNLVVRPAEDADEGTMATFLVSPWYTYRTSIKTAKFSGSVKASPSMLFQGCSALTSVDLTGLVLSDSASMNRMFSGCSALTSVDLTTVDTSSVTNMSYLFFDCSSLTSVKLTGNNTSKVTLMRSMFSGCSALKSVDLSTLTTSSVTDMQSMFSGCSALTSLDLDGFNTTNVINMREMFKDCSALVQLNIASLNTLSVAASTGTQGAISVTGMDDMFDGCTSLVAIALGEKFSFCGSGTERLCALPTPSGDGYSGKWESGSDNKVYAANEIPNCVADTYFAEESKGGDSGSGDSGSDGGSDSGSDGGSDGGDTTTTYDLIGGKMTLSDGPFIYMGRAITPAVTVTYGDTTLVEGTDYTVTYANNNGFGVGAAAVEGMGSYTGKLLRTFTITSTVVDVFDDAKYTDWYVKSGALDYAYANKLIMGYSGSTKFGAYDPIKRQDVAVILWRMAGEPEVAESAAFDDVNYSDYYGPAIRWARATGVINGYKDADGVYRNFGPSDLVTREQLACMIANYAAQIGGLDVASDCAKLDTLPDADSIDDWARTSFGWCMDNGIINGVNVRNVAYAKPFDSAWRASMASMATALHRDVLKLG